jgi:cardiolipin synthase (CMP-forming)
MNLPNLLSLFRLVLTLFFILLAAKGQFRLALLLFVLQAVSDMLDGFLARTMGAKTNLGSYLDPLADKVMLASSYIVLCLKSILPIWLVILVLARDLVITLGFLVLFKRGLKANPVPSLISKMTTVFQMLTVVYVLWSHDRDLDMLFYWVTALLTAASGLQYFIAGWTVFSRKEVV